MESIDLKINQYFYGWFVIIGLLHLWGGWGYEINAQIGHVYFYK